MKLESESESESKTKSESESKSYQVEIILIENSIDNTLKVTIVYIGGVLEGELASLPEI